ncbi:hypothetical protein SAMN05661096_01933 [Marivirga sericea]|uniref:Uncharacterized protein n=1 Tax=Marivirga sericea TaxID=1028 RepID=A0A1X7JQT0_9BACT|nr:hypothetical protein [Marivirga sericea]SMG30060.1 hypothetical protein SAMN05661096_01933 [Marivirga sericea]
MKYIVHISLLIQFLCIYSIQAQKRTENAEKRLGEFKDKIALDQYDDFYIISFKDISNVNNGTEQTIRIDNHQNLIRFKNILLNGFEEEPDEPIIYETEKYEFRLYYRNRSIRKDYVEVIVEDSKTEVTSTMPWLTYAAIEKLFQTEE